MRTLHLLILAVALAACGTPTPAAKAKSIYALTKDDFATRTDAQASSGTAACTGQGCLQVTKGDVLLFTATGTVQTTFGAVGPGGSELWGGNPFVFVNRPAFGVFGKINDSVFLIGHESVVIVPSTGWLDISFNGCTNGPGVGIDCTTTGSFSVSVYSKLQSGVTLASTPALTDNTAAAATSFALDAAQGWQTTGVSLDKGQKVFISAPGMFTTSQGSLSADGDPSGSNGGTSYVLVNRFAYRLYGRVNDNVIELGADGAFLSPSAGTLELVLNHRSDATGTVQVSIAKGVVPARGLLVEDFAALAHSATTLVPSTGVWTVTTLSVQKGDPLAISATGQLTGTSVPNGMVGPFGEGLIGGSPYALTNRPRFALYGRIGGEPFFLGGENVVLAPATGTLELVINNAPACGNCGASIPCDFCDVSGSFTATVSAP